MTAVEESFPSGIPWREEDLSLAVLDGAPPDGFDCGVEDYNRFLYQRAWRDVKSGISVTHLLFVSGVPAAFVTMMMDRVVLGPREKPRGVSYRYVSALKLAQLAVDLRFARQGLGRFMVAYVIQYARALRGLVGCRLVTLDAEPELVAWYASMGFLRNQEEQRYREAFARERGQPLDALPVSMRFDLRATREER